MRKVVACVVGVILLSTAASAWAREIHLPAEAAVAGNVIIADWFYEQVDRDTVVPRTFEVYQGVAKDADAAFFDAKVVAQPGDIIVLAPGDYVANLWVFTEGVLVKTADGAETLATLHGSLEIDADRVTLERVAVVDSEAHGIEINRELVRYVTIRGCRSENNAWIGIHLIGPRGTIAEYRIEDCQVIGNGQHGIDVRDTIRFVVIGCTIVGNGKAGVYIESYVDHVDLQDNSMSDNADGDVVYKHGS